MTSFIHETFAVILMTLSVVIQIECSKNLIHVPKCQIRVGQSIVQCRVPTWNPDLLEDHKINRSAVKDLHIYIRGKNTRLTKMHLRGLTNLESLLVVGICMERPTTKWCKVPVGLSAIEMDAFDSTPRLTKLALKVQPLKNFNAITKLRQLKYLHVEWMRSNNEFKASNFDNMRRSLKQLLLWYIPIKVITPEHFRDMDNLQKLEIATGKFFTIQTGGIRNLPRLRSLHLGSFIGYSKLTLQRGAISNLTKLEHVSLRLLMRVSGALRSSCSGTFNIVSVASRSSTSAIFDYCPQFLSCPKCGKNPHRWPQKLSFLYPRISRDQPKNRLLPSNDTIPVLNASSLLLYAPFIPYPFDMLHQMPLLKRFIVEFSSMYKVVKRRSFTRFRDNPFSQLPRTAKLNEIRITLKHCDCQLLRIIDWFKENRRFDSNKSINDVLKVDCVVVDGVCSDDEEGRPRQFIKWMNLTLITERLRPICDLVGYRSRYIQKISPSECRCFNLESCEYKRDKSLTVMAFLFMSVSFVAAMVIA